MKGILLFVFTLFRNGLVLSFILKAGFHLSVCPVKTARKIKYPFLQDKNPCIAYAPRLLEIRPYLGLKMR